MVFVVLRDNKHLFFMRQPILTTVAIIAVLVTGVAWVLDAEDDDTTKNQSQRTAQHEARQQRRAERLAKYEKFVDSLVLSHNYRFVPQTMPAGICCIVCGTNR